MRCHAKQRRHGQNAGPTDTCHEDIIAVARKREHRHGQRGQIDLNCLGLAHHRAFDRHKARAEAFDAAVILVAAGLVDPAFAAKFGLNRLDRHTIGLDRTVTATFADHGIDEDPGGRVGKRAALTAAAFLGGAGLVKNDDRTARCRAHLLLDYRQIIAVEQAH